MPPLGKEVGRVCVAAERVPQARSGFVAAERVPQARSGFAAARRGLSEANGDT
jgi:hypothetical protein